jgi:hypothetical protein
MLGDPEAAVGTLTHLLVQWREAGAESFRPAFLRWLGWAHAARGDPAGALAAVDEGIAHVHLHGDRVHEPELHRDRALLLRSAGDERGAVAALREGAALAERLGLWSFALRARTELAASLPGSRPARVALRHARGHVTGGESDADVRRAEEVLSG